jgi:hypothetical protein
MTPDPGVPRGAAVESYGGEDYVVRTVTGSAATKPYRCPGCGQSIRPATPHTVAWPVVGSLLTKDGLDERRHWHTGCWKARERRR